SVARLFRHSRRAGNRRSASSLVAIRNWPPQPAVLSISLSFSLYLNLWISLASYLLALCRLGRGEIQRCPRLGGEAGSIAFSRPPPAKSCGSSEDCLEEAQTLPSNNPVEQRLSASNSRKGLGVTTANPIKTLSQFRLFHSTSSSSEAPRPTNDPLTSNSDVDAAGPVVSEAGANAEMGQEVIASPAVRQSKCILLTGFGGPRYVRVELKDDQPVGHDEVAIRVSAW
ncbi:unnamed protein product, partial [Protopolystoma xenopodis]